MVTCQKYDTQTDKAGFINAEMELDARLTNSSELLAEVTNVFAA